MGTKAHDQQLRDALGTAAEALWEDEGAARVAGDWRRPWRIGLGVGLALTVVAVALVVAVLGSGPAPTRSSAPPALSKIGGSRPAPRSVPGQIGAGGPGVTHGAPQGSQTYGVAGATTKATAAAPSSSASATPTVPALPSGIVGQSAKVEMNGSASLQVARHGLSGALAALTNMTVGDGGYVASSSVQTDSPSPVPVPVPQASTSATGSTPAQPAPTGPAPSANLTLEIPVADYQVAVNRLGTVGRVTSLNTHAADVTGQYTDLQARITALQASRQQYLTIMTQATTISDILAVQSQIDQLQSQIEQLQGQLNLLTSETTYGTLAVSIVEAGARPTPPPPAHPGSGVGRAWHGAVHGFLAGVEGVVHISGALLFVLLCFAIAVIVALGLRRLLRRSPAS